MSQKRAITQSDYQYQTGSSILQWYKLLQTLNENTSLHKLLSGNEKCDDTDAAINDDDDVDGYMIFTSLACYAGDTVKL